VRFGVSFASSPAAAALAARAEELGYDAAWFYDTPLVCSDPFVAMALAAERTSRIELCLGVAITRLRLPHVLATAIGTLNLLAPGRVVLGFGTGYTGALTLGLEPSPWREVMDHVEVCRALLAGREADMLVEGRRRRIRHLHPDLGYVNVADPVPIYVSANGPKGIAVAADVSDGLITITAGERPTPVVAERVRRFQSRAEARGQGPLPVVLLTAVAVQGADEPGDSERLRSFLGPWATSMLHGLAGMAAQADATLPESVARAAEAYSGFRYRRDAPWLDLHRGHSLYVRAEEEPLVTAELLRDLSLVGAAEALVEEIGALEQAGVTELVWQVLPGHEGELERFATEVVVPYRAASGAEAPGAAAASSTS
jgi:5,10-methylenetetrahydromethanopterin reductase